MIILHQPPPAWGLPSISPFCTKLETYLRMSKIEYKTARPDVLKQAPNGRVPYINLDGVIIGDSNLIIKRLKEKFGDALDDELTPQQRAQAVFIQRLIENHLYFSAVWLRWTDAQSWQYIQDYFRALLPRFFGGFLLKAIRKNVFKTTRAHGIGEHAREDIISFAKDDFLALSNILGSNAYFLGERPTSIDATVYGFLIQILWVPWSNPLKEYGLSLSNLDAYCYRMKREFWT